MTSTSVLKYIYIYIIRRSYEYLKYIKTIKCTTKNYFTAHVLITQPCQVILHFGVIIPQLIKLSQHIFDKKHVTRFMTIQLDVADI